MGFRMAGEERFISAVIRVRSNFVRAFESRVRPLGLTFSQALMIYVIGRYKSGISKIELAEELCVDRSFVTNTLKNVADYIVVTPTDGRRSSLTLSEDGKGFYEKLNKSVVAAAEDTVRKCTVSDVKSIKEVVNSL